MNVYQMRGLRGNIWDAPWGDPAVPNAGITTAYRYVQPTVAVAGVLIHFSSFTTAANGLIAGAVASEKEAQVLQRAYGGGIVKAFGVAERANDISNIGQGIPIAIPFSAYGQDLRDPGWMYWYVPPGASGADQQQFMYSQGLWQKPQKLNMLTPLLIFGALLCGGLLAAAAAPTTAGVSAVTSGTVVDATGTAIGSVTSGVVTDAAGTVVGTVGETFDGLVAGMGSGVPQLSAAEMAAASATPAVFESVAAASGLTPAQLTEFIANGTLPPGTPNGPPVDTTPPPATVPPSSSLPGPGAASALLPAVTRLFGGTPAVTGSTVGNNTAANNAIIGNLGNMILLASAGLMVYVLASKRKK